MNTDNEPELEKHEYRCDICQEVKHELLCGPPRLVWLRDKPDKPLKTCAECHHRLTREKAIDHEAL
jgi:hypothetical protein